MHLANVIMRELWYRRTNFALGVASVAVAVGCAVAEIAVLQRHDAETARIVAAKEAETRARMAALEDDYRKITLGLGFNVLILPRDQNLSDLFAEDYASRSMPEEYVQRLANSRVATIQHLLPTLQQKLKWPEADRTIILAGVRGEVPILQGDRKKPLLEAVSASTIVLGSELHHSLKLEVGDKVKLLGREFRVSKVHAERGTKDDITAWINLAEAQELLLQPGRINGILALECVCAAESLSKVRAEIVRILPDTQVIEFQSQMLARAEARQRAAAEAREAVERERQERARLRQAQADFAAVVIPLLVLGAAVWIGFLALFNVRERRAEIAVLRALGLRSGQVLWLFLGRAFLVGITGAVLGLAAGMVLASQLPRSVAPAISATVLLELRVLLGALVCAPFLSVLAAWLPALAAAQQDPASILQEG